MHFVDIKNGFNYADMPSLKITKQVKISKTFKQIIYIRKKWSVMDGKTLE